MISPPWSRPWRAVPTRSGHGFRITAHLGNGRIPTLDGEPPDCRTVIPSGDRQAPSLAGRAIVARTERGDGIRGSASHPRRNALTQGRHAQARTPNPARISNDDGNDVFIPDQAPNAGLGATPLNLWEPDARVLERCLESVLNTPLTQGLFSKLVVNRGRDSACSGTSVT
jgi:hypothetical protein